MGGVDDKRRPSFSSTNLVNSKQKQITGPRGGVEVMELNSMIRTKCQNMLRRSGHNAIQKLGRTKRQPQKKRTKCQPFSWQFICLLAFCLTTWDGVISRTCRAKYFVSLNNDAISY